MEINTKIMQEIYQFRKSHLSELLGLETDPDGNDYMLLTRDEKGNIIEGVSFDNELDEIISYIEHECEAERELCEDLRT